MKREQEEAGDLSVSEHAQIRQIAADDRDRLWRFFDTAYGELSAYKTTDRWNWQYVGNPFVRGKELPIWIAEKGTEITGAMCAQPVRVQVGYEDHDGAWAVDLVVLPSCRGEGIGGRLHAAEVEHFPMLMKLTMAHATRRMAERADCVNLGDVQQYTRWTRLDADTVRRFLFKKTKTRPALHRAARAACSGLLLAHLLPALINPFLALRDIVRRRPARVSSIDITRVQSFGAGLDELWERTRRAWGVAVHRNARFLNWRFAGYGRVQYHRFEATRDGQVTGYIVLRRPLDEELDVGIVVDLYAAPDDEDTLDSLLAHAIEFFGADVAAIEAATTIPAFQRAFARHGFFVSKREHPTCVCDPEIREDVERLRESWFLSKADHDWDQIHPAPR